MINNGTLPIHPRAQLVTLSLYIHSQYVPFEQSSMAELVLVCDYWTCIILLISYSWTYKRLLSIGL
jgi:hypothetical protein